MAVVEGAAVERMVVAQRSGRISRRFVGFAVVGFSVFAFGTALLFVLARGLGLEPHLAYFVSAIASVELNFTLNRWFNWADRKGILAMDLIIYNLTKVVTVVLGQLFFAIFLGVGVPYLLASIGVTGVMTIVNFFGNDRIVFRQWRWPLRSDPSARLDAN